jgi:hypothetical protein
MPRTVKRNWEPYYCETRKSWVVPLTMGLETLIDEQDVKFVSEWFWQSTCVYSSNTRKYIYAASYLGRKGRGKRLVYLHRFLMQPKKWQVVDHLNGNMLDNRRSNLRVCTQRENMCNQTKHRNGRLVGAQKRKDGKFYSCILIDGKHKHLGSFNTEIEAHQAYLQAYNDLLNKEKSAA